MSEEEKLMYTFKVLHRRDSCPMTFDKEVYKHLFNNKMFNLVLPAQLKKLLKEREEVVKKHHLPLLPPGPADPSPVQAGAHPHIRDARAAARRDPG